MPIEIRELVIRATVNSSQDTNPSVNTGGQQSTGQANENAEKVIDQVVKILKQRKER